MTKLPPISGKDCVRKLERAGFYIRRQEGSHIIMRKDIPYKQVVVPNHRVLDRGTLRAILRQCDIEIEEFINL